MPGYHLREIEKGELGSVSKVIEELQEYEDALDQNSTIMCHVELADVYGALEALAETHDLSMDDLKIFSNITKRAFQSGERT